MEVNALVSLMRSHQFDKAMQMLKKIVKGGTCHPAVLSMQVFFMLREKKYTEALDLLDKQSSPLSVFLRVHIHQQQKKPVLAVDTLLEDVLTWKAAHVPEAYV